MARLRPEGGRRTAPAGAFAMGERRHVEPDGRKETLRVTASEVVHLSRRGEKTNLERMPLAQLRTVRRAWTIGELDFTVALTYILAASILAYTLLSVAPALQTTPRWTLGGAAVGAATVAGLLFWAGRRMVLVFVGRHQRIRYPLPDEDDASRGRRG